MTRLAIIALFALVTVTNATALKDSLSFRNIYSDYKGVCLDGNAIIVYGTSATLLKSTDLGRTWVSKSLKDLRHDVVRLRKVGSSLIGLMSNGKWLTSSDGGVTWNETEGNSGEAYLDYDFNEENIFALRRNSIEVFDLSLKLIKSLALDTLDNPSQLLYFADRVYIAESNARMQVVNLADDSRLTADLSQPAGCTNCRNPVQMTLSSNALYALQDTIICRSIDTGKTWQRVSHSRHTYEIKNDSAYVVSAKQIFSGVRSYRVHYYKTDLSEVQNFEMSISRDTVFPFIGIPYLINLTFVNDTTLISVGADNAIAISRDGGQHWEMTSFNDHKWPGTWFSDSMGVDNTNGFIYVTHNAGLTWRPTTADSAFLTFQSRGPMLVSALDSENVIVLDPSSHVQESTNAMVSHDGGITFTARKISKLWGNSPITLTEVIPFADHYSIVLGKRSIGNWTYTEILNCNSDLVVTSRFVIDSTIFLNTRKCPDGTIVAFADIRKVDKKQAVYISRDQGQTWSKATEFEYMSAICQDGLVFENKYLFLTNDFRQPNDQRLYYRWHEYDIDQNILHKDIFIDSLKGPTLMGRFGDKIIVGSYGYTLINDDNSQLNEWRIDSLIGENTYLISYGSPRAAVISVSETKDGNNTGYKNVLYTTVKIPAITSVTESEIEETKIYAFPSFPNPATLVTRCIVYWDMSVPFSENLVEIYNSMGEKVEGHSRIDFQRLNNYSGVLMWFCTDQPLGVYFIKITHGDSIIYVPVVVSH